PGRAGLLDRPVGRGALAAVLRVRPGGRCAPPYRVHVALGTPGPGDERVDGAASRRLGGGAVRGEGGRHDALRCGTVRPEAEKGTVTTVAQPATARKGFGNTRFGGAPVSSTFIRGCVSGCSCVVKLS